MDQSLRELCESLQEIFPNGQIPPGRNPDIGCIRLTLDDVKLEHRPLAFYFVIPFIAISDLGRLSLAKLHITPLPRSRIRLLPE